MPACQQRCQRAKGVSIIQQGLPKCQRAKLKECQLFNLVCQLTKGMIIIQLDVPIFQLRLPKGKPIFQLFLKRILLLMNFSIMLNICKFLEYLGNCRNFISRNKEFKFGHSQNFIKEKLYQPKTFNGTRGINQTIIRLV